MGVALAFRTDDSCCFSDACTLQAITADTVIAYITHDDRPYISSASNWHKSDVAVCVVYFRFCG